MYSPNFPATAWRKSSYSAENGSCVEIALTDTMIGIRDSKNTNTGHLTIGSPGWTTFISTIKGK